MLGLTDIFAIIKAVLQFPATILQFVKLIQKLPEEKHDDLLKRLAAEEQSFEESGRPKW